MCKLDRQYLRIAQIISENSYANKMKVGALIVKDQIIIADGFNGSPAGFDNTCEDENGKTFPWVLHAEANAITKIAKSNNSSEGSTIYTLVSPCMECAKLIVQAKIKRVVYAVEYKRKEGLDLLRQANIEVTYIDI